MFHRKSTRLVGYDYANENYYYVTICTHEKRCIFGDVKALSKYGKIAEEELLKISKRFGTVKLDKYMVMPNHIHAIIVISSDDRRGGSREEQDLPRQGKDEIINEGGASSSPTVKRSVKIPTLTTIIGLYKSGVSKRIHQMDPDLQVWQRSFYDHIIRNERSYLEICRYIEENPIKWEFDKYYSHDD